MDQYLKAVSDTVPLIYVTSSYPVLRNVDKIVLYTRILVIAKVLDDTSREINRLNDNSFRSINKHDGDFI